MNISPTIIEGKIMLRKPIEKDVYDYFDCGVNKELTRMYGGDTRDLKPMTIEQARAYIEEINSNKLNWCIEFDGKCIGLARLTVIEGDNRARYAVGIFNSSYWAKGIGSDVTRIVLKYAFQQLKLHRVDLKVLEFNHRAIRCYEKCGFSIEGREREGAFIEGKYETDIIMSILEQEYMTNT